MYILIQIVCHYHLKTYSAGKHNRHWAGNIISNKTGDKIYIAAGSGSNVTKEGLFYDFDSFVFL